jgi:diguanylate cyclase (GGDEF)-like protein
MSVSFQTQKCTHQSQDGVTALTALNESVASKSGRILPGVLLSALLVLLYFSSLYNYLLFHSLAEMFSICIAFSVFNIAWNTQDYIDNDYLLFIGISYLFIGSMDLFHTLSYKGMRIFVDYDYYANQLWIAARFMEAIALLIAFGFLYRKKKMNTTAVFVSFLVCTALIMLSIFVWKLFPICFVEGKGLTRFKVISEYVISGILLLDTLLLIKFRQYFDTKVFRLLILSLLFTIASELAFTFYVSNYGLSNLVGHYYKIFSFYFLYKAIVVKGINAPFSLVFRELKIKEKELLLQNELLVEKNKTDAMTGLYNNKYVNERLNDEIERSSRYGTSLSIIMFDIDHFKNVNDTFGHQFGDDIIVQIAQIIRENIRKIDVAGRVGGEEFIVILPQTNQQECFVVAEKIRLAVRNSTNPRGAKITISGGTTAYCSGTAGQLIKMADDNLYRAKRNGRDRVEQ